MLQQDKFFLFYLIYRADASAYVQIETMRCDLGYPNACYLPFQRPRVCILGGGFGGLYTALRLESLFWPDDKKPQV
jgi:hypothetical protein